MSTEIARMKTAIESQRRIKLQAETKTQSLDQEEARLFTEAAEEMGHRPTSAAEIAEAKDESSKKIVSEIEKMRGTFEREGVSY